MGKGRRYDQEYKDMIVELFKSGMSLAELSSEYGIAKSTINGWVKDVKEIKVDENEVMTLKEVKALRKEKTMLVINLVSVGIAIGMFTISAYLINNLKMLLISIVIAIMICSVLSEIVVMKTLDIFDISNFWGEIIMTAVFVATTMLSSQMIGVLIYAMAVALFLIFNRKKYVLYFFRKV